MDGLNKEDAVFMVEFISLLESKNSAKNCFGNMYDPDDKELMKFALAIQRVAAKHVALGSALAGSYIPQDGEDEDTYMDGAHDMLYDLGLAGGDFYTRVMHSFKVEYIPEDIKIEDVTSQF